ncbi:hypothetical protein GLAREA_06832 [Glarea lozoyensis ATCC 20868]|uniref:Uncharacterized protein n=1 Tax=Glarea lozoyensis (strain ATCC 20868 / MF5171) TaxID=1116229 RepID=S3D9N1_GLAL2|nr:uncharacterized protein GLAREA_06832 [Glarea lozoyensis ATCC 20868]EPE33819.1 hypothetical protein GLAREA_06832 [Glarea lozoyensis ATCC 20868]
MSNQGQPRLPYDPVREAANNPRGESSSSATLYPDIDDQFGAGHGMDKLNSAPPSNIQQNQRRPGGMIPSFAEFQKKAEKLSKQENPEHMIQDPGLRERAFSCEVKSQSENRVQKKLKARNSMTAGVMAEKDILNTNNRTNAGASTADEGAISETKAKPGDMPPPPRPM